MELDKVPWLMAHDLTFDLQVHSSLFFVSSVEVVNIFGLLGNQCAHSLLDLCSLGHSRTIF